MKGGSLRAKQVAGKLGCIAGLLDCGSRCRGGRCELRVGQVRRRCVRLSDPGRSRREAVGKRYPSRKCTERVARVRPLHRCPKSPAARGAVQSRHVFGAVDSVVRQPPIHRSTSLPCKCPYPASAAANASAGLSREVPVESRSPVKATEEIAVSCQRVKRHGWSFPARRFSETISNARCFCTAIFELVDWYRLRLPESTCYAA